MTKNIIIIGNSGAAIECYDCLQELLVISSFFTLFNFKGFLSHKGYNGSLGNLADYELGNDAEYSPLVNDVFILGIGDNKVRQQAYEDMKAKNGEFINLISPSVFFGQNVVLGEGNTILKKCNISDNCIIGNINYFNGEIIIGHEAHVGNNNFFAPRSTVLGKVKIGNNNKLGTSTILLENSKIGNNNTIAPAAVVYKGCKDNTLMTGNPAVKISDTNKEIMV